jgi:hypothetical protein
MMSLRHLGRSISYACPGGTSALWQAHSSPLLQDSFCASRCERSIRLYRFHPILVSLLPLEDKQCQNRCRAFLKPKYRESNE